MARKTAGRTTGGGLAARLRRKPVPPPSEVLGPSPNVATNLAIADIAMRTGSNFARAGIERVLLGKRYRPKKAKAILKGRSITETMLHGALARVAMRSVPGAILVGGGLLAKTLYDRTKAHEAHAAGEDKLGDMAESGED